MVSSDTFAEFPAPLGRVTMRRMFGKTGVFCDGVLLGMVTDNMLYFRVDDDNRAAFKEAESFRAPQLREEGLHHRPFLLARPGTAVRRTR
jgi:DNA transformation protein